jgi:hypothetical protein
MVVITSIVADRKKGVAINNNEHQKKPIAN